MSGNVANLDREQIAKSWRGRGFGCDMWTSPPGTAWSGYARQVDEILCVVRGTVTIETASQVLQPALGEEVVIPAGTRHSVINAGDSPATWLYGYRLA